MPRLSADVDVTLALEPDAPDRFARDMATAGFTLRVDDPDFVRRTRVMPFVHEPTGMPVDVVLAGSGLEDGFLDRAVSTDLGGGTVVPVIAREDLIVAKVLAGRPKDLDDASALGGCTVAGWMPAESAKRSGSSRRRSARATCCPPSSASSRPGAAESAEAVRAGGRRARPRNTLANASRSDADDGDNASEAGEVAGPQRPTRFF